MEPDMTFGPLVGFCSLDIPEFRNPVRPHCRTPASVLHELLIANNANQNDSANDCEVQRTRYAEEIDEVLQNLQQDRAEHDAEYRSFAAAQRAAAENRRCNGV
jgi:hypothetical protein